MIEAALLTLEFVFVILLLYAVNRSSKPNTKADLGFFSYKTNKTDDDLKSAKKKKASNA